MYNPQLTDDGKLKHLLSIEGLPKGIITQILDTAESFVGVAEREVKKVPLLRGKTVCNIFFENSTRTRTTFEIAAKRLSADVINLNVSTSSQSKGETILDTVDNLTAMHADMFVIRHAQSGAAHFIARHVKPHIHVINAGDGRHAHPTQALLDVFTIREKLGCVEGLEVLILGDILFSRVARSNIWALTKLGARVTLCGPSTLAPAEFAKLGVRLTQDVDAALRRADVVNLLRIQHERQRKTYFPSTGEYSAIFGLTTERFLLTKPEVLIMHPGPINRGVEIASEVADCPRSVILEQVSNGLAVRMAALYLLNGAQGNAQAARADKG